MSGGIPLSELAEVVRSKNAGPYELTLDIIFREKAGFDLARRSGIFTPALFACLYRIPEDRVLRVIEFPAALAVKATIVRPCASGDLGDSDVYGAQQHGPLLDIVVPRGESE